ncbi:PAQR family membrane homeostasis protein TrhA [Tissierella praeacuta]|uniref:PAQR family membrane homeostasis protein TrhA n=1 Tax=Tissierella praeacuta TaxID=43131 RepID=UPI00104667EF|nr:hemolysin III family protein [Tissierella praeacuta]TCU79306.1 hemolysin III [Tissierella praeacuta]
MNSRIKDPFSAISHLIGAILSIIGSIVLIYYAKQKHSLLYMVSFIIYGISLISLYTASTVYHWLPLSDGDKLIYRKIDHMMIYVLIAGTYTPICLISLHGPWGWSLFIGIWAIAMGGIILKSISMDIPRWISTAIYIIMGWIVAIALFPLKKALSLAGISWLIGGGILYTVGAIIYGQKWPHTNCKWFGFHELFHLFVMAGSACHFWMIYKYVL